MIKIASHLCAFSAGVLFFAVYEKAAKKKQKKAKLKGYEISNHFCGRFYERERLHESKNIVEFCDFLFSEISKENHILENTYES